jgi:hypothetical protein
MLVAVWFVYHPPANRKIAATIVTTFLGLVSMEAEYWMAHGFPYSDVPFFLVAAAVTITALFCGRVGGLILGFVGLGFFSYVNLRYGAPYLLDYVMPALYALLVFYSRHELNWVRPGVFRAGVPEGIWFLLLQVLVAWRTSHLFKWGWLVGDPW